MFVKIYNWKNIQFNLKTPIDLTKLLLRCSWFACINFKLTAKEPLDRQALLLNYFLPSNQNELMSAKVCKLKNFVDIFLHGRLDKKKRFN